MTFLGGRDSARVYVDRANLRQWFVRKGYERVVKRVVMILMSAVVCEGTRKDV